jgi:methylmalonyl-CoA epimerase
MPYLEHIGLAVADPEAVAELYDTLLGVQPYKRERVEREGVQTHFIAAGSVKLELLEALGPDSPVARYLEKRGEGLHHLAFEVDDIHAHMATLREKGFTPLSDAPKSGADGKLIFFLHPKQTHGVLIEFCQRVSTPLAPTRIPYHNEHLAAYERGNPANPTLVVLHGAAGATWLETAPLIAHLEQRFHVFALDFAGHGASDALAAHPFSIPFFANNVLALFEAFDLDKAHLFGFSMGGSVALQFAFDHPARVDRLAVHAANIVWDERLVQRMNARLQAEAINQQYPALATHLDAAHGDWQHLFERMQQMVRTLPEHLNLLDQLTHIPHPTLVSAVDQDDLFALDATLALHRALPDSTLAILPGTRHAFADVDPTLYNRLLVQHFKP